MNLLLLAVLAANPTIEVKVSPKGSADVFVEGAWGVVAGRTGVPVEVKPGPAVVRVTRSGYWDAWATVTVQKTGHRSVRVVQKPGLPLEEFALSGQVFFPRSGSWQRNEKSPWKLRGKEIVLSDALPGSRAAANLLIASVDNYVMSCQVYWSGNLKHVHAFGQPVPKSSRWTTLIVCVINGREYVSYGANFKKATLVRTKFEAYYPVGAKGEMRIRAVQWKQLGEDESKVLGRMCR